MYSKESSRGYYSSSYKEAKERFLKAAKDLNSQIYTYQPETLAQPDLTIDVSITGDRSKPVLVVSSGVHGVEGFFGSAVQLAWLEGMKRKGVDKDICTIFIHAVNPFGFANIRRVNEENVDLNRNFLPENQCYRGAPDSYKDLNEFLNPEVPPGNMDLFFVKVLGNILKHGGLQSLKNAVAGGQYEFPKGIFYGGAAACESTNIIKENCSLWFGETKKLVHIDLHTGLGRSGAYKILLAEPEKSPNKKWYAKTFGKKKVEFLASGKGTAYKASGIMGEWLQNYFQHVDYRFAAAEFGTYPVVKMLKVMRRENSFFHYGEKNTDAYKKAVEDLKECFFPASNEWRRKSLHSGLEIINQAVEALKHL